MKIEKSWPLVLFIVTILLLTNMVVVGENSDESERKNHQIEHSTYYPKYNNSSVEISSVIVMPNGTKYILWHEFDGQLEHKHVTGISALDSDDNEVWRTHMTCAVLQISNSGLRSILSPLNFGINEEGDILISILSIGCDSDFTLFINEEAFKTDTDGSYKKSIVISINASHGGLNWFKLIDLNFLNIPEYTSFTISKLGLSPEGNPIIIGLIIDSLYMKSDSSSLYGEGKMILNLTGGLFKHGGGYADILIFELNKTDGILRKQIAISSPCTDNFRNMIIDDQGNILVSVLASVYSDNSPRGNIEPGNFSILDQSFQRCHRKHQEDDPPGQLHMNDPEFHLFLINRNMTNGKHMNSQRSNNEDSWITYIDSKSLENKSRTSLLKINGFQLNDTLGVLGSDDPTITEYYLTVNDDENNSYIMMNFSLPSNLTVGGALILSDGAVLLGGHFCPDITCNISISDEVFLTSNDSRASGYLMKINKNGTIEWIDDSIRADYISLNSIHKEENDVITSSWHLTNMSEKGSRTDKTLVYTSQLIEIIPEIIEVEEPEEEIEEELDEETTNDESTDNDGDLGDLNNSNNSSELNNEKTPTTHGMNYIFIGLTLLFISVVLTLSYFYKPDK